MKDLPDCAPARRKQGLTITSLDSEVLVYDPEARRASCLNGFAAEVLSLCDGGRSAAEIAEALPFKDVDERMVWLALADLRKARLLQDGDAVVPAEFAGTNRRELLKHIGLGAAVAAPVVAGVAVPSVAQAATCGELGASCSTGAQGKSTCCPGYQCTGAAGFKKCTQGGGL
jgi:hypothetical protein